MKKKRTYNFYCYSIRSSISTDYSIYTTDIALKTTVALAHFLVSLVRRLKRRPKTSVSSLKHAKNCRD